MKTLKCFVLLIGGVLLAFFTPSELLASSTTYSHCGYAEQTSTGIPLDGTYSFVFRLCDCDTGECPWEETQELAVDEGHYCTQIGTSGLPATGEALDCVEVQIGNEVFGQFEMSTVPYARIAEQCLALTSTTSLPEGIITSTTIADGTITASDIATGILSSGDITGVTAGTGLSGGGASGDVTLNIGSGGVTTTQIADGTITAADIAPGVLSSSSGDITGVTAGTGLSGGGASSDVTLSLATPVAVTSGGSGTATQFTSGSVVFSDAGGIYTQDNSNLYWDDASNFLGVGTNAPGATLDVNGIIRMRVQSVTFQDDGGDPGTVATLTPTSSYITMDCGNDGTGTNVTLSETGAVNGQIVTIIRTDSSMNSCNLVDSAGVVELGNNLSLGQYDSAFLIYISDRWVRLANADN